MSYQGEAMINIELDLELLELFIVKLMAIICDYNPRQGKLANDSLPYEVSYFGFHNESQ